MATPEDEAAVRGVLDSVKEMLRYAEAATRIRGTLVIVKLAADEMRELLDSDVELGPEILAAANATKEAAEALHRAHEFAAARMAVRMEQ